MNRKNCLNPLEDEMENSVDTLQKVIKFVVPLHKVKALQGSNISSTKNVYISPASEALRKAHLAIHLALPALASSLPILIPLLQDDSIQRLPQGFCVACHGRFSRLGIVHIDGHKSQRRLGCGKDSNTSLIDQSTFFPLRFGRFALGTVLTIA